MNTLSIKKFLFGLALLLATSLLAYAQPAFPPTAYPSCDNCVPNGYSKVDDSYAPAISSPSYYGNVNASWTPYNGQDVPPPPSKYSQGLGDIHQKFVSLKGYKNGQGTVNIQEAIETIVSGFKPTKSYTITYSVLSSAAGTSTFGKSAKLRISTDGQFPLLVDEQETIFGLQRNVWITKTFTFVALAETLVFRLSAGEMDAGGFGYVNFDIDNYPFSCNAGSTDAPVAQTSVGIACPNTTFDLTTIASNPPAGIENVWYTYGTHAEEDKVADPTAVPVGTYYLFRYDPTYECFNVQQSNSKVEVKNLGDISLKSETASNLCPATSVNLADQVNGFAPSGHLVQWFTTKNRSTQALFSPVVSTSGKYYAFLYNFSSGCYYKEVSEDSVDVTITNPCCEAGTEQVKLISGSYNIDCGETANLSSLLSANNNLCNSCSIAWFTSKNHAPGTLVFTPGSVKIGKYYAFIFDSAAKCFNTDNSNAEVIVTGLNGLEVELDQTLVTNQCPSKTVNLNNFYSGNPPNGFTVVFYKTPNHAPGTLVLSNVNTSGTYYAFYFNQITSCFTSDNSQAAIEVVIVDCEPCQTTGSDQVDLQTGTKINICPAITVDLNSAVQQGTVPAGSEVVWYDNPFHQGIPLTFDQAAVVGTSGTYYAFLHDLIDNGCYNTGISTSAVDVTINAPCPPVCNAGSSQVALTGTSITNTCPSATVNLNGLLQNLLPGNSGLKYVWFDNATHSGLPIANANSISADGFYYAFIFDENNNCYNTDNSSSVVTVILQECKVFTTIKVKLQGAMSTTTDMHNNLRISGLLPTTDQYGLGSDAPSIFFTELVDWVKVEIRSAANPANVLESKSFMLKTDGTLERYDGVTTVLPYFKPQLEPVHIVVRHRNHVAVMSTAIADFTVQALSFDFTTGLQQCYNDGSAPAQMTEVNGVWCMSVGDVTGDETLDDVDNHNVNDSFHQGVTNQYVKEDMNMDGVVDDVDISLFNQSYYKGLFSIITKY